MGITHTNYNNNKKEEVEENSNNTIIDVSAKNIEISTTLIDETLPVPEPFTPDIFYTSRSHPLWNSTSSFQHNPVPSDATAFNNVSITEQNSIMTTTIPTVIVSSKREQVENAGFQITEFLKATKGKSLDDPLWKSLEWWEDEEKRLKNELKELENIM
jgi:hypothetical protein